MSRTFRPDDISDRFNDQPYRHRNGQAVVVLAHSRKDGSVVVRVGSGRRSSRMGFKRMKVKL